jgi:hypothetical protein
MLFTGISSLLGCCTVTQSTSPSWTDIASTITTVLEFAGAIISLIVLIKGINVINEFKLRGLDTLCGFLVQLKIRLMSLQRLFPEISEKDKLSIYTSPFYFLIPDNTRTIGGSDVNGSHGGKDLASLKVKYAEIQHQSNEILLFLKTNGGQIPLSEKMWENQFKLTQNLLDISTDYFRETGTTAQSVQDFHWGMQETIKAILSEIDEKSPAVLNKFWKMIKIPKAKSPKRKEKK